MSSHDDSFVRSGNSPTFVVRSDCWLTTVGIVPVAKGKEHRDYFVPRGEKPSKQFGFDLGHIRVSTLGTNGSTLHFEFKELNPRASSLIVDAIEQSDATIINLEFHSPTYTLRSNLTPAKALTFLKPVDLLFENHLSIFLIRPISAAGQTWLHENITEDAQTFGNSIVCEPRYVEAIFRGATADRLVCR